MRTKPIAISAAALSLLFASAIAGADEPKPTGAAPDQQAAREQPAGSPLAGPKVDGDKQDKPLTLVERDYEGRIKRLETNPAIAALELLDLSPEERVKANEVIAARNAAIDEFVEAHVMEIVAIAQSAQAGDRAGTLAPLRELLQQSDELRSRELLVNDLAAVLSEEHAAELRRLTREYALACIDERMKLGDPRQPEAKMTRFRAGAHETLIAIGQEVKQSYERVFVLKQRDFEALVKKLNLTPEQDAKVRGIVQNLVEDSRLKPSARQTTGAFIEVYKLLDEEQRKVLMKEVGERRRAERAGAASGSRDSKPSYSSAMDDENH